MALSIEIKDEATPLIQRVAGAVRTDAMNKEVGQSVVNRIQAHFFQLDQERPNALGGKRTHFYSAAAKGTQFKAEIDQVTVSVNALGIRQRLEGGVIKPVHAKYLTIPAIAEAYGKRAREFDNLQVIYNRNRQPVAVAEKSTTIGKGKKARTSSIGRVFFLLVKSVMQKPDRSVLPSDETLRGTAVQAMENFTARLVRRDGHA